MISTGLRCKGFDCAIELKFLYFEVIDSNLSQEEGRIGDKEDPDVNNE